MGLSLPGGGFLPPWAVAWEGAGEDRGGGLLLGGRSGQAAPISSAALNSSSMPRPLALPPLRNWQDFEDLCLDLWRRLWNDPDASKHGRQGQRQAGVDVYGRPEGGREWAGVQCKRLEDDLTPKMIEEEVAKARTFEPALSRFVI